VPEDSTDSIDVATLDRWVRGFAHAVT